MKPLAYFLTLFSFSAWAGVDPCEVYDYPVIWEKNIIPGSAYELPAIYTERNGIKSIVSVQDAHSLISNSMSSHQPYLKKAKQDILQKLKSIESKKLINERELWIDLDGLQGQQLNTAIHIMAGYQNMFVEALLENIASIEIDGSLETTAKATFMKGSFQEENKTTTTVSNLLIRSNNKVIYQYCRLD